MPKPSIYLFDNGSLRPEATFALRRLAAALTARSGRLVRPVSLLHSHKIDPAALDGEGADIVRRALKRDTAAGVRDFIFLPLFLGPSLAVVDYLPKLIAEARERAPDIRTAVAPVLAGDSVEEPDPRLAEILVDHVRAARDAGGYERPDVALVDHGTPIRPVNELRDAVAAQLADRLAAEEPGLFGEVRAASMERRPDPEYAFNEPLLERLEGGSTRALIVAMFFLLPGRHAGPAGDVAEICEHSVERGAYGSIRQTRLLAEHPRLLDILEDRLGVCSL